MSNRFPELSERLLRAGVAPKHVRRLLAELSDHLDDVKTEQKGAGSKPDEMEARVRLGSTDELVEAMAAQPNLRGWWARAPLAMCTFTPLLLAAFIYCAAISVLWSGWQWFLPGSATPFVPVDGAAMVFFGLGRLLYFAAPVLAGWAMAWLAVRQRLPARWVAAGTALTVLMTAMVQVQPFRSAAGSIRIGLHLSPSLLLTSEVMTRMMLECALVGAGYIAARSAAARIQIAD